jgi:hypothetical protein
VSLLHSTVLGPGGACEALPRARRASIAEGLPVSEEFDAALCRFSDDLAAG